MHLIDYVIMDEVPYKGSVTILSPVSRESVSLTETVYYNVNDGSTRPEWSNVMKMTIAQKYAQLAAVLLVLCTVVAPAMALTATVSSPILPKGVPLSLSGETDHPGDIAVWIVGRNYYDRLVIRAPDGTFTEEILPATATADLSSGQYFLVLEDTGPDGEFALETVTRDRGTEVTYQGLPLLTLGEGDYPDTAMALFEALNRPGIDDGSHKMVFLVEEPWMRFEDVPDGYPGDVLRIAGSTNLPPGTSISCTIFPATAEPDDEPVASSNIQVVQGGTHNYWYMDVDCGGYESGEYVVMLDSGLAAAVSTFTLTDAKGTAAPTPGVTVETLQGGPESTRTPPPGDGDHALATETGTPPPGEGKPILPYLIAAGCGVVGVCVTAAVLLWKRRDR